VKVAAQYGQKLISINTCRTESQDRLIVQCVTNNLQVDVV